MSWAKFRQFLAIFGRNFAKNPGLISYTYPSVLYNVLNILDLQKIWCNKISSVPLSARSISALFLRCDSSFSWSNVWSRSYNWISDNNSALRVATFSFNLWYWVSCDCFNSTFFSDCSDWIWSSKILRRFSSSSSWVWSSKFLGSHAFLHIFHFVLIDGHGLRLRGYLLPEYHFVLLGSKYAEQNYRRRF